MQTNQIGRLLCLFCALLLSPGLLAQTNLAQNKTATASTAMTPAANAVDGNGGTRWESNHGVSPSWVSVDLGASYSLSSVVIDWEAANAANYEVQGSANGTSWTTLATRTGGTFGTRTDTVAVTGLYRYVRVYATQRSTGNNWGYSIWELKVYGAVPASSSAASQPANLNLALGATATASTQVQPAALAIDNNGGSRWESAINTDPSWISLDFGSAKTLSSVVIDWEAANAANYQVQGSNNNSTWTTLATRTGGTFGNRTDTVAVSGSYRYLRIYGTARSTGNQWGYSIFELKVYGSSGTASSAPSSTAPSSVAPSSTPTASSTPTVPSSSSVAASIPANLTYNRLFPNQFSPEVSRNWRIEPDGTIVTFGSGRARSRHEAESIFYTFPAFYHEHRTFKFEVHDHTPKGESRVEIFYEPEYANFNDIGCRKSLFNPYRSYFGDNGGFTRIATADPATGKGERWRCVGTRFVPGEREGQTTLRVGEFYDFEFQQWLGFTETDPRVSAQRVYYTDTFRIKLGSPGLYIVNNDELNAKLSSGGAATAPPVRAFKGIAPENVISTSGVLVDSSGPGYMPIRSPQAIAKGYQKPSYLISNPANNATVTYREGNQTFTDQVLEYTPGAASAFVVERHEYQWTSFFREALNTRWETHNGFLNGRRLFHTSFVDGKHFEPGNPDFTEMANLSTGLTINNSCVACHVNNGRGTAPVNGQLPDTMAVKVSSGQTSATGNALPHAYFGKVLQPQSRNGGVPAEANTNVNYTTVSGTFNDGTPYQLQLPNYSVQVLDQAGGAVSFFSPRMAQTIVGLGLLEAVPEATLLQRHDPNDSNGDGISGRANQVSDLKTGEQRIGRFGWKATIATLEQFTADALHEDIGVSTTMLQGPACGANQTACRNAGPAGVELSDARVNLLAVYMQALGAPARRPETVNNADVARGEQVFANLGCGGCHTPSMTTDYGHPLAELRGQTIKPYTDLLLHDMGAGLADNLTNSASLNREWRTPALWGLGLTEAVNGHSRLLHDGRARNINEAILWHGGEAAASQAAYRAASAAQRNDLIKFLESL
ncbi:di-heme oxidoredictase family protein [Cellvibrio sp. pealriver]|uniref:di-heme oxidoredictase family protein n=1 Tax=Cellvibrio sp. pealriver TaxID=1622269 RepID=UPI00066FCF3A|nr:di-heme oxidoredictase family protein [Cellvibrio sp. pealriver]